MNMTTTGVMTAFMAASSVPLWVQICGRLAPLASIIVFLAPLPTIRSISIQKSVGNLPLLPYSTMVTSCFVWVVYGLLINESKVWTTNSVGLVLGVYYFLEYIRFSPKKSPILPGSVLQHVRVSCLIMASIAAVAFLKDDSAFWVGSFAVFLCVVLFASPLAALKTVLQQKSAKSIPLPFTITTLVNCSLWAAFGLLDIHDVNVYVPNILGLACGVAQLFLKLWYGDGGVVASGELPK